jgi:cytochrome c nitrite reductase small subunit
MPFHNKWFLVSIALALLIIAYAGAGFSMRTTDTAPFCGTCHVMNEVVRTHQKSVHAGLTCNECHAPQDSLVSKMIFKTRAGMRDIYVNTLGTVPDLIQAKPATRTVINQNCKHCHFMTILNIDPQSKAHCTDCHRQVPHFKKIPIAQRRVAYE